VLLKYLHSRPIVDARYPNATADQRLGGLLCIRKQVKTVKRKDVACYIFRHDDFEGQELHCVCRWSTVKEEGPSGELFDVEPTVTVQTVQEDEEAEMPILEGVAYDVDRLRAEGYGVDDDNEPAPENIPTANPWHLSATCTRPWL
jgi:hypothetical protein